MSRPLAWLKKSPFQSGANTTFEGCQRSINSFTDMQKDSIEFKVTGYKI